MNTKPTLLQGAAQPKFISRFKTDPADKTVSTSILTVKAPNADFDGDALNYSIAIDEYMARAWEPLAPHHNIFVANTPREVSGNIALPKPVVATFSAWLKHEDNEVPDANKLARFNAIPVLTKRDQAYV